MIDERERKERGIMNDYDGQDWLLFFIYLSSICIILFLMWTRMQ